MSELVEKVARAICQTDSDPDELIGGKPMWTGWKDEARAAIAAVAEWLEKDCGDEWFKARHLFAQLKEGGIHSDVPYSMKMRDLPTPPKAGEEGK